MHNGPVTADDSAPNDTSLTRGTVTLRTGTADDAAAVLTLWERAGVHPTSTDDVPAIVTLVARDDEALLIAERGGVMVGTLIASWNGWRGTMYRLAVVPELRRRGIASALVREGERRLRQRGCRRAVALIVDDDDDHAVGFWTGVGYTPHPMQRYVRTLGAGPLGADPPARPAQGR